jgi:beta-glucosidase
LVSFTVRNLGRSSGAAVAQVYAGPVSGGWEAPRRLGGWRKVELAAGASTRVSLEIDPRLLALFDAGAQRWKRVAGKYELWLGGSSADLPVSISLRLPAWQHAGRWPVKDTDIPPGRFSASAAARNVVRRGRHPAA